MKVKSSFPFDFMKEGKIIECLERCYLFLLFLIVRFVFPEEYVRSRVYHLLPITMDGQVTDANPSHDTERELYVVLVKDLSRDPSEGLHIIGLWLWLSCATIIKNMMSVPLFLINELADEAVKCLRCLNPQFPGPSEAIEIRPASSKPRFRFNAERSETQLTRDLLNTSISLQYLREKQRTAFREVQNMVSNVCIPTLADLFERARQGEFRDSPSRSLMMPPVRPRHLPAAGRLPGWNVGVNRTLFVTFTGGNIVWEHELAGFLMQTFGCCLELVYMQEVLPGEQPLYARVLLDGPAMMSSIVEDDNRAKYNIKGKDVWIRRYVPRWNAWD